MSKRDCPRIGSDRSMQGARLCDCCTSTAKRRVDVQVNWFRGDDEVLKLCDAHYPLVKAGEFDQLLRLRDAEKARRRQTRKDINLVSDRAASTLAAGVQQ